MISYRGDTPCGKDSSETLRMGGSVQTSLPARLGASSFYRPLNGPTSTVSLRSDRQGSLSVRVFQTLPSTFLYAGQWRLLRRKTRKTSVQETCRRTEKVSMRALALYRAACRLLYDAILHRTRACMPRDKAPVRASKLSPFSGTFLAPTFSGFFGATVAIDLRIRMWKVGSGIPEPINSPACLNVGKLYWSVR